MPFSKLNRAHTCNGILFVGLFALASLYLAEIHWLAQSGISALVIAILLGIIYGNTLREQMPAQWVPGIQFSAKRLLRLAIILYGFRVSFQQIASVGMEGLLIDIVIVVSTLLVGTYVGIKFFKLDKELSLLISSGAAICGAAAVLAVEDMVKSEAYKASVAVGTVVLFGTIAMFLYPVLQHKGLFGFTDSQFGVYVGASVHEVAQALVAGSNVSSEAGNVAVIVKMTRVLLLVPVLLFLSIYASRAVQQTEKRTIVIPWFALGFAAVIGFNSLHLLPQSAVNFLNHLDILLLTMAMAAIGIETNLAKIKKVGLKPLYLALFLFAWLMGSAYLLIRFI